MELVQARDAGTDDDDVRLHPAMIGDGAHPVVCVVALLSLRAAGTNVLYRTMAWPVVAPLLELRGRIEG